MAATYSSFMTTRYYSPVFNTALFDGPLRIYFSQSYESAALKIYHLLQSQYEPLWNSLKAHATIEKEHIFLMIYPEAADLKMVFGAGDVVGQAQTWDEGLAIGLFHDNSEEHAQIQIQFVVAAIQKWLQDSGVQQHGIVM